jgi:hypothetical protein
MYNKIVAVLVLVLIVFVTSNIFADNGRWDCVSAEVKFNVLELKHKFAFNISGESKGLKRQLSRVTAKMVNLHIYNEKKYPEIATFLRANAPEIDLAIKHPKGPSYFADGYSLSTKSINTLLSQYKGKISVRLWVENARIKIDLVALTFLED